MNEHIQTKDPSPILLETRTSIEAIAGENLGRRRGRIRQFLGKVKNVTKKISVHDAEQGADPQSALQDAKEAAKLMKPFSWRLTSGASAARDAPVDLEAADNFQDTYLQPLRIFDSVIGTLADVHPYSKTALGLLSYESKILLAQSDRDLAILRLLEKLCQVYDFMVQGETLREIPSMQSIVGRIVQQTLECSQFIRDYSATKSFWKRLGKNGISETDNTIQQYINVLDALMQSFRDQVTCDAAIYVHRTGETLDLNGMVYAEGAGLDSGKQCLPGTRIEIISEIIDWVNSTGDNVQRVLWLSGPAGKGKSAIAHTIANWFNDVGGLGSCYCFDRQRDADRRHEKIFSTIARDLADRDPEMRRALAEAVQDASSLKTTSDIVQQWDKLLIKPLGKSSGSIVRPVVIVIDALDESGGVETRFRILRILAGKLGVQQITRLPANFRIIVTSRPLRDIKAEFDGAQHILRLSMDDFPPELTERDIYTYVSKELKGLSDFQDREFAMLAAQADGLFEWARLACGYIKAAPYGMHAIRFDSVMSRDPGKRKNLLYDMYQIILAEIMLTQDEKLERLAMFRSVMAQILGTAEPLSLISLNAMRVHFPNQREHYEVEVIVEFMGSLLSGTTNSSTPIKPLHTSFRDFLTDQSSSGNFFVDMSNVQRDLAFASLRVMEHGLRFNICDLKSSYLFNREDPGLQERVNSSIPPHLSYSCRFWPSHLQATAFDTELAKEVKSFFDNERLLFWLEVLGIIQAVGGAVTALLHITRWLKDHPGYEDVSSAAMDVQRFIQTFGGIILHSTPHLYVSALPFSPVQSVMSKFAARFPNTLCLASGRDLNWPAVQSLLRGHADKVLSVSFSPNRTRIVTGSADKTVRLWDAATGQPLGEPLRGHTGAVTSVSFSPDGIRIASGSYDKTIRLWDVASGQPVGEPLRGHTAWVNSVSFSPDGTRIVSGSSDNTVRLWYAATGQSIGEPLRGHTAWVNSASFSLDDIHIVSCSDDRTVRLWNAVTGQPVGEPLRGHTGAVTSVSFSPDGTRIASSSYDKTIRLWDVASGQPVGEPLRGHTTWVNSASFSPDGIHIMSGSDDSTIRLWDVATGQAIGDLFQGYTDGIGSASFSPDGSRIASGSADGTIRLWYAAIMQPLQDYSLFPSDRSRTITNSWDNHSICLSLNSNHALRNPAEFIEGASHHDSISTSFSLETDGWMVGPNRRLLFWVPPASRHTLYIPWTALATDKQLTEVDLSHMAYGPHWQDCRDEPYER